MATSYSYIGVAGSVVSPGRWSTPCCSEPRRCATACLDGTDNPANDRSVAEQHPEHIGDAAAPLDVDHPESVYETVAVHRADKFALHVARLGDF